MSAVETPDFKKLFGGGKLQRKYASKISPVADELADLLIAHAIEVEDSQGVYWFYVDNGGCVAWSIRQSDNILGLALTQIGAPSNYWQQQWYKLGKTITQRVVAAVQAKMQTPTEAPAAPQVGAVAEESVITGLQSIVDNGQDENSNVSVYANYLQSVIDHAKAFESQVIALQKKAEIDAAYMTSLEAKNEKLQGDLEAAQNIIVQAGDKVKSMVSQLGMYHEALGENQALTKRIKARAERPSDDPFDAPADILSMIDDFYAGLQAEIKQALENQATPTPPAQESLVTEPKFMLGQVVTIIVHIDKLSGIVIERKLEDNQWHYKVERPFTGITMWYTESELS